MTARIRCFWILWSLLAWSSAILCTAGCFFPYWLKGIFKVTLWGANSTTIDKQLNSHVGLFRRCVYATYTPSLQFIGSGVESGIDLQPNCGHYSFADIPHMTWKIGLITLAVSCIILFFLTFFIFVSGFNVILLANGCVCKLCQFGFLVSGLLVGFTCVMYPVGWKGNEEVRQICGPSADIYNIGHCEVQWAYMITILGGILSLLSTLLPCAIPTQVPYDLVPSYGKRYFGEFPNGNLFVSGANMPLLLARNAATPTDQSSLYQGSFSRKTSSVHGPMIAISSSNYAPTSEYRVLMPATPVIVQSS
ncbi:unnamed protein product [Rodentolepis nana]|uniref:Lipoma HMGIC fusion partner-like protein n=1 Tax=Rodentolepis nana TaxID=102285 RepID=A0A0R3TLV3_RODNA|nr:unnamed protein product [Rodentolepis nana]